MDLTIRKANKNEFFDTECLSREIFSNINKRYLSKYEEQFPAKVKEEPEIKINV